PKHYNVLEAKKEFDWIDETFVPVGQSKKPNPDTHVAEKAIPHLTVHLNGELQNTAPDPTSANPWLVIHLNGVIQSLMPLPKSHSAPHQSSNHEEHNDQSIPSAINCDDDSDSEDDDPNDLCKEVTNYYKKGKGDETDTEDGPDWQFDNGKETSKDPKYVLCPAPHQKQLLHIFTKHFCQHPSFVEGDGKWNAERIHREAVYEMYMFCHFHGLHEVWGYMWACWYSPKMWYLWAQSTSCYIPWL
ncbi:hypothetical protein C0995_013024, partial [Termitomyces sp. Mi166